MYVQGWETRRGLRGGKESVTALPLRKGAVANQTRNTAENQVLSVSILILCSTSDGSGKRPVRCLLQTVVPSTCTSNTPPAPSISLAPTLNSFLMASAKLAALG